MMKPTVVFTFSHFKDAHLPLLKEESKLLMRTLSHLHDQGKIELYREESAGVNELADIFNRFNRRIAIFHFGGHAGGAQLIMEEGDAHADGLAELFQQQKDNLTLVFLNGCSTLPQVKRLLDLGIRAVIATSVPIEDTKAKDFAEWFYQALGRGRTLKDAYDFASATLRTKYKDLKRPEIVQYRSIKLREKTPHQDFPWGLYVTEQDQAVLDWKLVDYEAAGKAAPAAKAGAGNKIWLLMGSFLVVAMLVFAGWYFFGSKTNAAIPSTQTDSEGDSTSLVLDDQKSPVDQKDLPIENTAKEQLPQVSSRQAAAEDSRTEPSGSSNTSRAVLELLQPVADLGTRDKGETIEHTFRIRNTGEIPLVITNVSTTSPAAEVKSFNEGIIPGGVGSVVVVLNTSGKTGPLEAGFLIETDADGDKKLTLRCTVIRRTFTLVCDLQVPEVEVWMFDEDNQRIRGVSDNTGKITLEMPESLLNQSVRVFFKKGSESTNRKILLSQGSCIELPNAFREKF